MRKLAKKWSASILTIYIVLSLGYPGGDMRRRGLTRDETKKAISLLLSRKDQVPPSSHLQYDFYRDKCPNAEQIIHSTTKDLYLQDSKVAPALLRLVFHDCFIEGCDASVLLDGEDGIESEKDAIPNSSLRGFDVIDSIKMNLERECPGTVSCADILVIAARDCVVLAGGPFYPVATGRRDSLQAFKELAASELPPPSNNLTATLSVFGKRGFNEREIVSILGAHSIGGVHCSFIQDRLSDFNQTGVPDPTLDKEFLGFLQARCTNSSSSLDREQIVSMNADKPPPGFDGHYYRSLLQGRGILRADQQLMAGSRTADLVKAYASDDGTAFRRDFARAMIKMSGLGVLTGSLGQVRLNCSRLVTVG